MNNKISTDVAGIKLNAPIIPASGVWPYSQDFWSGEKLEGIGAICSKAISHEPRKGNMGCRLWETPAGLLNSIGLQNIGVRGFVEHYGEMARNCPVPVIANVVMENVSDTPKTLSILQESETVSVAELNISCPNVDGDGMSWGVDAAHASIAVECAREVWKGPLWVKITPQTNDPCGVAKAIEDAGADAIVSTNTWLGMGMNLDKGKPAFKRVFAGLSGPAVFPLALRLLWQVCGAVSIPVVGCGGVSSAEDCVSMILAGASAVEVGTAFFRDIKAGKTISRKLPEYIERYGKESLTELIGYARS